MKTLRFFALLLILVVVEASAHMPIMTTGVLCGLSNDPTLCDQTTGEDLACTEYCGATCVDFTNVTATCVPAGGGYNCRCTGKPLP